MIKYKLLYEQCVEIWRQDWEFSKTLSDKARTYVIVIGLVFGYSLFNLHTFYSALETVFGRGVSTNSPFLLKTASMLFLAYFVCFAVSLICTLLSLRIRVYSSLPILTEIAEFKEAGPSDAELEQQYYQLSKMVQEAINTNTSKIDHQAFYLAIAIWCLTIGVISLILVGGLFIFARLF